MSEQLVLNLRLRDGALFEAYHPGPNQAAVQLLQALVRGDEPQVYLWGAAGTGKTHLLQAVCHAAGGAGQTTAYLPLAQVSAGPELLGGMEVTQVLALDDLDAVAGRPEWDRALFNLINALRERGHRLVLASRANPAHLGVSLPDLGSRLVWGPVFRLEALDDEAKRAALRHRALRRGFELPDEAARYMLRHHPRDLGYLLELLDRIDTATLAARRRATLPFIKSVLSGR